MTDLNFYKGSDAQRRALASMAAGHLGSTQDTHEVFAGDAATPYGYPAAYPQVPLGGADTRRLWAVCSQKGVDTWSDEAAVLQDASGIVIPARAVQVSSIPTPNTDPVALGYVMPYELADGGKIVMEARGTFKCGSVRPRILAKLKIGSNYVVPQYEATRPDTTAFTDVSFVTADAFEWSSQTLGLNALGGYEALNLYAATAESGVFDWKLTVEITSLGRYAKREDFDDDVVTWLTATAYTAGTHRVRNTDLAGRTYTCIANHTSGTTSKPGTGATWTTYWREISGNARVQATLEWGGLNYNGGGQMGEYFGAYNPFAALNVQWNAFLPSGSVRGTVYSFMGQQWLCHANATQTALDVTGGAGGYAIYPTVWQNILAEVAPGIGAHSKEFFVPLVSRSTLVAHAFVDWTAGNEIALELGGPTQEDRSLTYDAYGATTAYAAEAGQSPYTGTKRAILDTAVNYAAKTAMYASNFSRMVDGAEVDLFTAAATDRRCWRPLPAEMRDTMRLHTTTAYLFGGRPGAYQARTV